jgi:hypothetical protein
VNEPKDENKKHQVWESLKDAGLVEISLEEFPDRIREAKRTVMGRLGELIGFKNRVEERHSLAHSLGALKNLESTLRGESSPSRRK